MGWLDDAIALFSGTPESKSNYMGDAPNRPYPSADDVAFARKYDAFYGTGNETIADPQKKLKGRPRVNSYKHPSLVRKGDQAQPSYEEMIKLLAREPSKKETRSVDDRLAEAIAKSELAQRRSAIAAMGGDPDMAYVEGGVYGSDRGQTLGFSYRDENNPYGTRPMATYGETSDSDGPDSVMTHEAIHRGIASLAKAQNVQSPDKDGIYTNIVGSTPSNDEEEKFVRWIMANKMGNPEWGVPEDQVPNENYEDLYKKLEYLAAQQIKKKRPGGPR